MLLVKERRVIKVVNVHKKTTVMKLFGEKKNLKPARKRPMTMLQQVNFRRNHNTRNIMAKTTTQVLMRGRDQEKNVLNLLLEMKLLTLIDREQLQTLLQGLKLIINMPYMSQCFKEFNICCI